MKPTIAVLFATGALSGCYVLPIDPSHALPLVSAAPPAASVIHARLYPLNETAGTTGALTAVVSDNANGHATFSLNYAGELLQGEASRVSAAMPNGQRGIASAAGPRGTYVNCEYALAAPNRGS
jgi:hypothetical protein